jgi:signal peptidase I
VFGSRTFLYEAFKIPGNAMLPNLRAGSNFFVNKSAYGYSRFSFPFGIAPFEGPVWTGRHTPQRGDIAVFKFPTDTSVDYVKRIIGIPGDTVEIRDGVLYLNSKEVPRTKSPDFVIHDKQETRSIPQYLETLPGSAKYKILQETTNAPPDEMPSVTVPADYYFVLGDNRDHSQDSRDPKVGFIPRINIFGKVANATSGN